MMSFAQRIEKLEKEKIDRDAVLELLVRKVDRKSNDQLLNLIVNDIGAAKTFLKKQHSGDNKAASTRNAYSVNEASTS